MKKNESIDRDRLSSQCELPEAIKATSVALNLCLANKFSQAREQLRPWAKESMYHALGYGTIMSLQALMTFDKVLIDDAGQSIKSALQVCERFRRKQSWSESLTSFLWKPSYENATEEELHAELCYAECLLQRAILNFVEDESLLSFVKGGLKIRSSYHTYKVCYDMMEDIEQRNQLSSMFTDFKGGVNLGLGTFNLLLSLLPGKILRLLEFVGFSGDKYYGLSLLDQGFLDEGLRSPLCAMTILAYHTVITYVLGNGDGNSDYAHKILKPCIKLFPKGAIFLYYDGRVKHVECYLDEAIIKYNESIKSQSEWKQFHHLCYWELMWCYCFKRNWKEAYGYAKKLLSESRWSACSYMYFCAVFKLMARIDPKCESLSIQNETEQDSEENMFRKAPELKQRIAGKSIQFEKFSIKRCKDYFDKENFLWLPAIELIFLWNGFRIIYKKPNLVKSLLELVHESQRKQSITRRDGNVYKIEDVCLLKLLEGMCVRCLQQTDLAMVCFQQVLTHEDNFARESYLPAYTCAEVGFMHLDKEDIITGKKYLEMASKKYHGYILENRLRFRIHSALQDIECNQYNFPRTIESNVDIDVDSPSENVTGNVSENLDKSDKPCSTVEVKRYHETAI
ncbi:tetratricopeptide repeat protein 39B-like [Xenia sp. Carnegie-2017]|uniref:tetratricopeptide repeat protein 39B-like n=1 Tax=Xenia sp. Carnegie-2017 TaxID=2897299 RepID=UPI001F038E15|nr:tetratricopeptide repeat protein 39B-like [Xenia sp. Carnegie-2017]